VSPEAEATLCLPRSLVGWDVFCWIGHRRFSRHWSVPQIRDELQDSYQIRVSDDAIEDVIARYQAIVAAREQDPERLTEIYRDVDDVVLSIDGLQPVCQNYFLQDVAHLHRPAALSRRDCSHQPTPVAPTPQPHAKSTLHKETTSTSRRSRIPLQRLILA